MTSIPLSHPAGNSTPVSLPPQPIGLRALALAAFADDLERQRREEIEREQQRRDAHVELLRNLCKQFLSLADLPSIRWCSFTSGTAKEPWRAPVAEIDGLLFWCQETAQRPCLAAYTQRQFTHKGVTKVSYELSSIQLHSLSNLGQVLSQPKLILAEIKEDTVQPLVPKVLSEVEE